MRNPRKAERRLRWLLLYFRLRERIVDFSLLDRGRDGFLINPTMVDAYPEATTRLPREEGFVLSFTDDSGKG